MSSWSNWIRSIDINALATTGRRSLSIANSAPPVSSQLHKRSVTTDANSYDRETEFEPGANFAQLITETNTEGIVNDNNDNISNHNDSNDNNSNVNNVNSEIILATPQSITPSSTLLQNSNVDISSLLSFLIHYVKNDSIRLARQESINIANNQLHTFNFIANYASMSKCLSLSKEHQKLRDDYEKGKFELISLQSRVSEQSLVISQLTDWIDGLDASLSEQSQQITILTQSLTNHQTLFHSTIKEYNEKLSQQSMILEKQQSTVNKLLNVRFKLDFGIDLFMIIVSWYISHGKLLKYFLSLFINQWKKSQQSRFVAVSSTQFLLFILFFNRSRLWLMRNGIHSKVGNISAYSESLLQTLQSKLFPSLPAKSSITEDEEQKENKMSENDIIINNKNTKQNSSSTTALSATSLSPSPSSILSSTTSVSNSLIDSTGWIENLARAYLQWK